VQVRHHLSPPWGGATFDRRRGAMKKQDIERLRQVLRYVVTSDPNIQAEVLRLDDLLAAQQKPKPKEDK